jgi:dATP pyrophosphohydrolase
VPEVVSRYVEVCLFRIRADRGEYLLLRRAEDDPVHPGLWQYVTGKIEEGEKASDAALRELREETGAAPLRFWVVPAVNSFYDPRRDVVNLLPVFAAQMDPQCAVRLSAEHSEFRWLPYGEARSRLVWPGQRNCLDIIREYILGGEEAGNLLSIPV